MCVLDMDVIDCDYEGWMESRIRDIIRSMGWDVGIWVGRLRGWFVGSLGRFFIVGLGSLLV